MSISTKCPNCGRSYSVKNEYAGKKFRCQECQAAVTVPKAKADAFDGDDWDAGDTSDDYGSDRHDDYDDYDDYETAAPAAPRRASKRKKPAASKKRPKKTSSSGAGSQIGAMMGKIGGGLFAGLIAFSLAFKLFSGGLNFNVNWEKYTTPDGNASVLMPGKVKTIPGVADLAPGGQVYGAESRNMICAVVVEPMPPEAQNLSEEELLKLVEMGIGFQGGSNANRTTHNGRSCVKFDRPNKQPGVTTTCMAFVHKGKMYTFNFGYKGSQGSNQSKFFDSIGFN